MNNYAVVSPGYTPLQKSSTQSNHNCPLIHAVKVNISSIVKPEYIILDKLGQYKFKNPLSIKITIDEDGTIQLSNEEANLFATGSTIEEAKEDLKDDLNFAWNEYVLSNDSDFHPTALRYRNWLIENVDGPTHVKSKST